MKRKIIALALALGLAVGIPAVGELAAPVVDDQLTAASATLAESAPAVSGALAGAAELVDVAAAEAATGTTYTTRHCTYPAKARISVSSYGSAVYVEGRSAYTGALLGTYTVGANVRTGWINFGGEAITFRLSSAGSYGYSTTCF